MKKEARAWIGPLLAGVIVAVALASASPEFVVHSDEVQLAYGVDDFDIARHQPHPPGYYLFLVLGRLLKPLCGGSVRALQVVSALAMGVFVTTVWRCLPVATDRWARWVLGSTAVAFALLSPLSVLYGTVGLTYAAEGALWLLLCVGIARRPRGAGLFLLAFSIGLAAGVRQTLGVWGAALLVIEALRHRKWIGWRSAPGVAASAVLGAASWIGPLLWEAGGLGAWQEASHTTYTRNIWEKSLWHTGLDGLTDCLGMLLHGWAGLGLLLLAAVPLLWSRLRRRDQVERWDSLLGGALLALGFYGFLIYDNMAYLLAPLVALAAWVLLGWATRMSRSSPLRQRVNSAALLASVLAFPVLPGLEAAVGDNPYTRHARHDHSLSARFQAVRQALPAEHTVLVTSLVYWRYGFRHVAHYLPEYTTVQLAVDPFFQITTRERPYLMSLGRQARTEGPDGLAVADLLPENELQFVAYMMPHDAARFVDPRCWASARLVPTVDTEHILVIPVDPSMTPRISEQKLLCVPSETDEAGPP